MNKIQYIKLLEIRGITLPVFRQSIAQAVEDSGGSPTPEEMVKVNQLAMEYFINKFQETKNELDKAQETLEVTFIELSNAKRWIDALHAAGVDNWSGYETAQDIRDENT